MTSQNRQIKTILLVDDDPINNFLSQKVLNAMEIAEEVKAVTNGAEGISCLKDECSCSKYAPEIILLDINMPVMDGFEFLKVFNESHFENKDKVIIAVLSTSENLNDLEKMRILGIEHYMVKPLTAEKVNKFLDQLYEHS